MNDAGQCLPTSSGASWVHSDVEGGVGQRHAVGLDSDLHVGRGLVEPDQLSVVGRGVNGMVRHASRDLCGTAELSQVIATQTGAQVGRVGSVTEEQE